MHNIKRGENKVYTAKNAGQDVIVKSTHHTDELEHDWRNQMTYIDFISEDVSVAYFIAPGVEHSTDENKEKKLISVSAFANGVCPECVYNYSLAWITNEDVVRSIGSSLANMRLASQKFTKKHRATYDQFPSWDKIHDGW